MGLASERTKDREDGKFGWEWMGIKVITTCVPSMIVACESRNGFQLLWRSTGRGREGEAALNPRSGLSEKVADREEGIVDWRVGV